MENKLLKISVALNVVLSVVVAFLLLKGNKVENATLTQGVGPSAYSVSVEDGDVVFMGADRLAECKWSFFLANEKVKSLAINRNTIADDLKRMDMVFDGVNPTKFFLMYGEEELLNDEPVGKIASDYNRLLSELKTRYPATEVVVMSTLPISKPSDHEFNLKMAENVKNLNALVKASAYKNGYPFIDMLEEFSDDEGGLALDLGGADGFYLSKVGYVVLKSRIKDYLN